FLSKLPVDVEPNAPVGDRTGLGDRMNGRQRRGMIEALGHVPRTSRLFGSRLQVATSEVVAHGVAPDEIVRVARRKISAAAPERHHELHFVLQVLGARGVGYACA